MAALTRRKGPPTMQNPSEFIPLNWNSFSPSKPTLLPATNGSNGIRNLKPMRLRIKRVSLIAAGKSQPKELELREMRLAGGRASGRKTLDSVTLMPLSSETQITLLSRNPSERYAIARQDRVVPVLQPRKVAAPGRSAGGEWLHGDIRFQSGASSL